MWVRFLANFDFLPEAMGGRSLVAYKAGTVANVTRECAGLVLPVGIAEAASAPRFHTEDEIPEGEVVEDTTDAEAIEATVPAWEVEADGKKAKGR